MKNPVVSRLEDLVDLRVEQGLEKPLEDAGTSVEFHAYPGTDDAFMGDPQAEACDERARVGPDDSRSSEENPS